MKYLHANGVLHEDLKAANVLVDDDVHCVISDSGQSEMKLEAYRMSGAAPLRGTLRWQTPELMSGESQLAVTSQMDIYAYATACVEIVSMVKLPWPLADDETVKTSAPPSRSRVSTLRYYLLEWAHSGVCLETTWHH
ncbi:hypothetical protein H2248_011881 [Termitomyces sp. 'cryptogamus']|nr:hypothetical protein H2248_011881 [Termitomyces sp. 'cryptogamus']